ELGFATHGWRLAKEVEDVVASEAGEEENDENGKNVRICGVCPQEMGRGLPGWEDSLEYPKFLPSKNNKRPCFIG
ncbi:MAG: hypothetical protein IKC80_10650, partial [Kiritimatiellae bacterium]|nr:hypothetical protein [Kiritimatiellia bacterium]